MTLMPFSIPDHVNLLLSGAKLQTTRAPRKTPLKVGDILHLYYKPRQKKTCGNCIVQNCKTYYATEFGGASQKVSTCSEHRNFFGKAKVAAIIHMVEKDSMNSHKLLYDNPLLHSRETRIEVFGAQNLKFMEAWARADGFANFAEADKWFTKSTKNSQWMFQPWDVIIFTPLTKNAFGWTISEIQSYKELVCSEEISASCEDCSKTDEDLDNCFQDLKGDL